MKINYLLSQVGSPVIPFDEFQTRFFNIFTTNNFYDGKRYLDYIAEPQTNDEDNIVDTKIVLPLLTALGFESGDISKNLSGGTKDNTRPDFQVCLAEGNIRCFLVEDKHTAYDLSKAEPLQQLLNYAPIRGYDLGLICNGRLLLGWDLSNPNEPMPVLNLDIQSIIARGVGALTDEQKQSLKGLYRRFHQENFKDIEAAINRISKPLDQWNFFAYSKANNPNFDELLIDDLKKAITILEDDTLYQLNLLLEEHKSYVNAKYLFNESGSNIEERESNIPTKITDLRQQILNYLRISGLIELQEYSWANEKLIEYARNPQGTIEVLGTQFLEKLKQAEDKRLSCSTQSKDSLLVEQLDLLSPISESQQKTLGIKVKHQSKITKLDADLQEKLKIYQEEVFSWQAWNARQLLKYDRSIKTQQFFKSWQDLVTKTIFLQAPIEKLKTEFARQTAYVYVIRLLMVRICEDKGLVNRKFSDGGFQKWKEEVEPQYLDFAQGMSMDYLLEMSYRSAQSIYSHFFSNEDLFNWYRINTNTLIKVLDILNRFNLQEIDSDIIGMVYSRYVTEGKHQQGRYFTPKNIVEYMLDSIGYTANNLEIRDKKFLDLAGGSGSFLVHASRRLIDSYKLPHTGKIPITNVPKVIQKVKNSMFCMDINPFACYLAETNLLIQVIDLLKQLKEEGKLKECSIDRFNVYNTDSLLFPKSDNIRSNLLNSILDLELSTVSQIKHRTGEFSEGFDFIVGNPPYVQAEEPGQLAYRQQIVSQGRFETLYKKWDLFIPFIELSQKLLKQDTGKLALIVSDAFAVAPYGEKSREMLCTKMSIQQIDFFEDLKLFEDADVFNIVFIAENKVPNAQSFLNRYWHNNIDNLYSFSKIDNIIQTQRSEKIFRCSEVILDVSNTILLDRIVYISKGMVLNCHETKYPNEFIKDDLISDFQDNEHPVKYIEGKDIANYQIKRIRYLEFGQGLRSPLKVSRPTFPELYAYKHIAIGKTGGVTIVDANIYSNDSVRVLVNWHLFDNLDNRSISKEKVEENKQISKQFSLQYLVAIITSKLIQQFFDSISTGTRSDVMPDDLRKIPIKNISLKRQQPFIKRVDNLIAWNWEIYELVQSGHKIDFDYQNKEPKIEINFLRIFEQINPPCWDFLDAEPQRFEVIGDRAQGINKIKLQNNLIFNGKEEFIQSDSLMVLEFLKNYLPQYEKRGLTWTNLLSEGKIPKTDADIQRIFTEQENLKNDIQHKIDNIRQTYRELDEMVTKLYENTSNS
jgi:hypothetical protein